MKNLMKATWYIEAAMCGGMCWLALLVGTELVHAMREARYKPEFWLISGLTVLLVLVYAWKALRQQRRDMLGLIARHFGRAEAERCDWRHKTVAVTSVVLLVVDVFVVTALEERFGRVVLDVGFWIPIWCGLLGLFAKVVEAALVKWMPDERQSNLIRLPDRW